jgi:predicted alpha/beta hydrolase family esterase
MKKQVIVIHGGDSFNTYEEYISALKNWNVTIDWFRQQKKWKGSLQKNLGEHFDVLRPQMPNKQNARYAEWKLWFERMFPFLDNEVILIGHSLGGIFLVKYLTENIFPKQIKALFLAAAPHNMTADIGDFLLPDSFEKLNKQVTRVFLYHSEDDPVVPFSELAVYQRLIPHAKTTTFENRGHLNQEEFPELVAEIKKLSS